MIGRRLRETVVIETTTATVETANEYGDEDDTLVDYWTAASVSASVVPVDSSEDEVNRQTVSRRFDVYLPASATVDARARITITTAENEELVCRVMGEPLIWTRPNGRVSHKVARVEGVTG